MFMLELDLNLIYYNQDWTLLGKKDPQLPQAFYPVDESTANTTVIRNGDVIATRCTMDNWRDSAVSA